MPINSIKDKNTGKFVSYIKEKKCVECTKIFKGRMSSQKFCNRKCWAKWHGKVQDRKITLPCAYCKELVRFSPSNKKNSKNIFCNSKCYGKWLEETHALAGSNNPLWEGGKNKKNIRIRKSAKYKRWRMAVFQRDNYTCQGCGIYGRKIHADHIKPFAHFEELRFDIENGRTLCVDCHKKTPTYLRRLTNEQIKQIYAI